MSDDNIVYRGVRLDEKAQLWQAVVYRKTRNGKNKCVSLGHFATKIEAAKAYDKEMDDNNPYWHVLNFYPDGVVNPNRLKKDVRQVRRSGYFGVQRCEETGRFLAECYVGNGQHRDLGVFDTPEEAARAHDRVAANRWGPQYMNFPENYTGPLPKTEGSSSNSGDETARVGAARRGGKHVTPATKGKVTGRSSHGRRSAAQNAKHRQSSDSTLRRSGRTSSCGTTGRSDGRQRAGSPKLSPSSTHPPSTPPQDGTTSAAIVKSETPDVASSSSSSTTITTITTMDQDISTNDSLAGSSGLLTDTSSLAQPFVSQSSTATQSLDSSATNGSADISASSPSAASRSPQSSRAQTSSGTVTQQLQVNGGTLPATAPSSLKKPRDAFDNLRSWTTNAWAREGHGGDARKAADYQKAMCALHQVSAPQRAKILVFVEDLDLDLTRSEERQRLVDIFVAAYKAGAFNE